MLWIFITAASTAVLTIIFSLQFGERLPPYSIPTPWQCIGGCGAGGAGGSAADIKWIGEGVRGGLLDIEALGSLTIGEEFEYKQFRTRFSIKPTPGTETGITIPVLSKTGLLQPKSNFDDKTEISGGVGDIMIDFSKKLGMEGEYSLLFNLFLPTGRFDIKRGREQEKLYLPVTLQNGTGVYIASAGLDRTVDVENGLLFLEGYFLFPFAVNFRGKNRFVGNRADEYNAIDSRWDLLSEEQKKRFRYYFKPYGENDLGRYIPPAITAAVYYGNRRESNYIHSYGMRIWIPLGVAWIPAYPAGDYNPVPDPNNKSWGITLHYGLEFSRPKYPLYLSVNKIITGASTPNPNDPYDEEPLRKWHRPDLNELIHDNWIIAFGIKATMF